MAYTSNSSAQEAETSSVSLRTAWATSHIKFRPSQGLHGKSLSKKKQKKATTKPKTKKTHHTLREMVSPGLPSPREKARPHFY